MTEAFSSAFHYWVAGGPLLGVIAFVSLLIWCYFLNMRTRLSLLLIASGSFEEEIERRIAANERFDDVGRWLLGRDENFFRMMTYVLKHASVGEDIHEAVEECRRGELPYFERGMTMLAALVAAAPLLGLLGTVFGMIDTFWAVSRGVSVETAGLMAKGISQALITTQFGLVAALPGVFGLAKLHQMYGQLEVHFSICESHIVSLKNRGLLK